MTDEELEQQPLVQMARLTAKSAVISGNLEIQSLLSNLLAAFAQYHKVVLEQEMVSRMN